MNKKTLTILASFFILIISSVITDAADTGFFSNFGSPQWAFWNAEDPYKSRDTPWYAVEPWEIEVCSKWGGSVQNNDAESGSSNEYFSMLTLTLNADKIEFPAEGKRLYSVSYYIRPISGDVNFSVSLVGDSSSFDVETGVAGSVDGSANYKAFYNETNFTKAKMQYDGGTLIVPIVQR